MADDASREPSPLAPGPESPLPKAPLPPLLDYPSPPPPPDLEREPWSDVVRAMVVVFTSIAILFFGVFGICGLLGRGCG